MTKYLAAAALAILIASPAFAARTEHQRTVRQNYNPPAAEAYPDYGNDNANNTASGNFQDQFKNY